MKKKYERTPEYLAEHKIYTKKYIQEHPEAHRKSNRKCYHKNIEKRKESRERRKDSFKRYNLKRNYGLTMEQYFEMLDSQGGTCAICNGVNQDGRRLSVDHDHVTNAIRGILCSQCNFAIGLMKDDTRIVEKVLEYLNRYKK